MYGFSNDSEALTLPMPTLSMSELPPPRSWDEFEEIAWDLLSREWNDPNAVRHGRQGQAQQGVDIYGRRQGQGPYIGAQCKPVSYTHLRAHETDSYLVCRLLLEKKKK